MISYIDAYKDQFGVEAICRVLKQADRGFITSRGYSRRIVGVATRSTMRTDALPMEALEHALTTAGRIHGNQLIHHSDRGSQYVSLKYSTALAESGIRPSVGTVGDSYDNALAETVNGLYKAELIHAQGP